MRKLALFFTMFAAIALGAMSACANLDTPGNSTTRYALEGQQITAEGAAVAATVPFPYAQTIASVLGILSMAFGLVAGHKIHQSGVSLGVGSQATPPTSGVPAAPPVVQIPATILPQIAVPVPLPASSVSAPAAS